MSGNRPLNIDSLNPLFIHPSDGPSTITLAEKLTGSTNYRAWKRAMEISLSTKRKLAFIQGTIAKANDDPAKADLWEACNNMVIAWLMNNVSDTIARSILYIKSAAEIWSQLDKRFAFANGSRKYQLNKQTYALKQDGQSISDYYTKMKGVWEELESMNELPCITTNAEDVTLFLACLQKQMAEHRLFQFLNGLDDTYQAQRSQILLMHPLPSVEVICGMLQQEEQQRQVLEGLKFSSESSALLSKNMAMKTVDVSCSECGNKGHTSEKCWHIIGFPSWHVLYISTPCVSTGGGPNGKRVEGFLYRYRKGEEVRIVCVCHGSFLTPAEFIKHAGGGDVENPLRHIVVNPSPFL